MKTNTMVNAKELLSMEPTNLLEAANARRVHAPEAETDVNISLQCAERTQTGDNKSIFLHAAAGKAANNVEVATWKIN